MTSEIDARYENVFPDDHGVERVDQPEFIDNWKSMPGNAMAAGRVKATILMILPPGRRPCAIMSPNRSPSPLPSRPSA
jgi:hypothetical protein